MTLPRVSVVIPLFNARQFIAATLASVCEQSFREFEILVVNDGSSDGSDQIIAAHPDPRLHLLHQDNQGVAAARNTGLAAARGALVAFLDADDLWQPAHLEHLLALADRFPKAVLFGNRYLEFQSGAGLETLPAPDQGQIEYRLLDDYIATWARMPAPFHTSSSMARRDMALHVGGFPQGHNRGEDLTFFVRLALQGDVAVSGYVGCGYRRVPSGLTSRPLLSPDICMITIAQRLASHTDASASRKEGLHEYYCKLAIANATDCLLAGHRREALDFLELARNTRWHKTRWWQLRLAAGVGSVMPLGVLRAARRTFSPFLGGQK